MPAGDEVTRPLPFTDARSTCVETVNVAVTDFAPFIVTVHAPAPLHAPSDRGPLSVSPFPGYSPDGGLGEWGVGWATSLSIKRTRVLGIVDYQTDDLSGPWGRMVLGSDGAYYAQNLGSRVRVVSSVRKIHSQRMAMAMPKAKGIVPRVRKDRSGL